MVGSFTQSSQAPTGVDWAGQFLAQVNPDLTLTQLPKGGWVFFWGDRPKLSLSDGRSDVSSSNPDIEDLMLRRCPAALALFRRNIFLREKQTQEKREKSGARFSMNAANASVASGE